MDRVPTYEDFFATLSKELDFDPIIPDNWYPITFKQIRHFKVPNANCIFKINPLTGEVLFAIREIERNDNAEVLCIQCD